jgi:hypothetical protein
MKSEVENTANDVNILTAFEDYLKNDNLESIKNIPKCCCDC